MDNKYNVTFEFKEDEDAIVISKKTIACTGFALLAIGTADVEGIHDATVTLVNVSTDDIKDVIKSDKILIRAACLAKGEMDANNYGSQIAAKSTLRKMLERMS